ncbi:hypothetical protein AVEN_73530-1 [Araneus ventricosus]|uniref:Uncharacterized protein n=1 Tax=Araneus ventricosus TaxID=182803 RepID=A0A4Y2X156_ARAVE|nr:hypothetical protein AVEN_229878-1 [Araneus ventricosus]GBO42846.1 hypothetical protein AVEN_73530-1 [Araneus ventricosus]
MRKKYILPVLEKLKEVNYSFNDMNELQKDGKTEYRSNGIDLFSYLMRNEKANAHPPPGFNTFLQGILKAKICEIPVASLTIGFETERAKFAENTRIQTLESDNRGRLCKLSNRESSPETSETQSIKWTNWKDLKNFSTTLKKLVRLEASRDYQKLAV